jgi:hypothetical protein
MEKKENKLQELKKELLALPIEARALLAHALLTSLDETFDQDAEALWREKLEDLVDYLGVLEARAQNFGKPRYRTEQVRKMLRLS